MFCEDLRGGIRRPLAVAATVLGLASSAMPQERVSQRNGPSAPPPAAADSRLPIRWWKDDVIVAKLVLTTPQVDRIDRIFEAFLPAQRERWSVFRPLKKELDDLLLAPHPNEAQVIDRINRVETLRAELNRQRLVMLFRMQQVLTPAQRARLQKLGWPGAGRRE